MNEPPRATRSVKSLKLWQRALVACLGLLVRVWGRTFRVRLVGAMPQEVGHTQGRIVLLWHNTLFALMELKRRYAPHTRGAGLISASGDGAWLASLIETMGLKPIRGSSSFRGAQAFLEAQKWLQDGGDLAITPDGPRGPRYHLKAGAALLAKSTRAPIILVCPEFQSSWRFKSWDGFHLPKPFCTILLKVLFYENFEALGLGPDAEPEAIRKKLELELRQHGGVQNDPSWVAPNAIKLDEALQDSP